jgi:hypothetical protein
LPQQADVIASPGVAAVGSVPALVPVPGDAGADYLEQSALIAGGSAATGGLGAAANAPANSINFDASAGSPSAQGIVLTANSSDTSALAPLGSDGFGAGGFAAAGSASDGVMNPLDGPGSTASPAPRAGAGLIINLEFDAQALAAPQSFRDGMQAAANILEASFSNPITINIAVGFGEFLGGALPNQNTSEGNIDLNGNDGTGIGESYTNLRNLLATHETSADDTTSVNSLPNAATLQGQSNFIIGSAEAKAMGVLSANATGLDGAVGMGSNFLGNVLISGALHEISHAMGRIAGGSGGGLALDLFRFSSAGTRLFGQGSPPAQAAFFSIDGGNTKLADFGQNSDPGDFLNPPASNLTPNDPFNENVGNLGNLTALDIRELDVIGFTVAGQQPPPPPPPPPPTPVVNVDTMPPADFNHGGTSDVITFATDGTLQILSTTNGVPVQAFNLGSVGTNFTFGTVGHFFGSGAASDFIMRGAQGLIQLYQIQNDQIANAFQEGSVGTDFQIVSVGDYFQTGTDDLLMRSATSGGMELYKFQNGQIVNALNLGAIGADQQIVGQGNFLNNGTEDFMAEQNNTGLLGLYQVKNGQIVGFTSLGSAGADAHVVGIGDFNGDGVSDALIERNNGTLQIYEFQNGQITGTSTLGQVGLDFQAAGVGDFFGNGTDDFMMRSGQQIELYKIQNYQIAGATSYGAVGTNTQIAGAYFNHLV